MGRDTLLDSVITETKVLLLRETYCSALLDCKIINKNISTSFFIVLWTFTIRLGV